MEPGRSVKRNVKNTVLKSLYTVCFLCFLGSGVLAQHSDLSIGLRFGSPTSLSITKEITVFSSVESILIVRPKGFLATGLYEQVRPLLGGDRWAYYYGFGGHLGAWRSYDDYRFDPRNRAIGVDGIVGIRYRMANWPLEASLDWKPAINLLRNNGPRPGGSAFSVRYRF